MLAISQEVLDLAEAARYLRVSEVALKEQACEGLVPARKIGKDWRFFKPALDAWLSSGLHPANGSTSLFSSLKGAELLLLLEEMRRLLHPIAPVEEGQRKYSKERLGALIGSWKDDPYAEELLRQIEKERGHSATEEEE